MRPAPLDIKRQGDLGGKKIPMRVNVKSLDKIMTLLTDLYSDPAMAVIREYSTNAYDAHVAAGNLAPIEISTPSGLHPFFRVKDYGIGMSIDDLEQIYCEYATTTKDTSDDFNGILGIGSKSALTFTQQFSLVSVYNGVKALVSISRTEDGTGEVEIVDTKATDESNGVEIIVPVTNHQEFNKKISHFYQFWKPGTVLVDGVAPKFIGDMSGNSWIDDDIVIMPKSTNPSDYVVMGNVAYPTTKLQAGDSYSHSYKVVAFVGMGEVQFPPNRESLHYTNGTLATVEKIRVRVEQKIAEQGQAAIDACSNYEEAEALHKDWKNKLPAHIFNYKGLEFKNRWQVKGFYYYHKRPKYAVEVRSEFTRDMLMDKHVVVVTGFPADKITPATRTKTRMYLQTLENPDFPYAVLYLKEHPDPERLLELKDRMVDWEVIKAFKIVRVPKEKSAPKWTVLHENGSFYEVDDLDDEKETLYIGANQHKKVDWYIIRHLAKTHNVVKVYVRHSDAFHQTYPEALQLIDYLRAELALRKSMLTDLDKATLSNNDWYERQIAQVIDIDKIQDPELAEYLRNRKGQATETLVKYQNVAEKAEAVGISPGRFDRMDTPMTRYPLARHAINHPEHAVVYMNAMFALKENSEV